MTDQIQLWHSVVLGVVEGITEFLPVSSTGHLTVAEDALGLNLDADSVTGFTAVIQDGAILAAVVYFWTDIWRLITGFFGGLRSPAARTGQDWRMAWYVIAGTIPIGIVGFLGKDVISGPLRNLWWVVAGLIVWSGAIVYAERSARQARGEEDLTLRDAIVIGLFQCVALIPGVSRSGATISAGLWRGIDRVTATRMSFLLGIPALLAAGAYELPDALGSGVGAGPVIVGTAVSFAVAYVSIAWLLKFVAGHSIAKFVPYRIAAGVVVAILVATSVLSAH